MRKKKVVLPENYSPYDMELKKLFHVRADKLNIIGHPRGFPQLLCGAMKQGQPCKKAAGSGTSHTGYGRCKYHGGASTGPKSPEGKAIVSRNSTKHGFYRSVFLPGEVEIFDQFTSHDISLQCEISLWKSMILRYLQQSADKWQQAYVEKLAQGTIIAEAYADHETRAICTNVDFYTAGQIRTYTYHTGTIEDTVLIRALGVLARLIDAQLKLNCLDNASAGNILDQINAELKSASFGQVSIALE